MIELDGREGEGGGQVLRIALALSAVTGTPFRIHHIRGGRAKPGLLRQHLTGVRAVAEVCQARVEGASLRSTELVFEPGAITGGDWTFEVGTAGSAGLVLQALLPVLWSAPEPSTVTVTGGTHNPAAPPADFLVRTLVPALGTMGVAMEFRHLAHGFFPAGGGSYAVRVTPGPLRALELEERGPIDRIEVTAWLANLPERIGQREIAAVREVLDLGDDDPAEIRTVPSPGPGNAVTVAVVSRSVTEVFTAFGRRGVPAEDVGREVAEAARAYLDRDVPVGPHLADQLIVPLALAGGRFVTGPLTEHARTGIAIVERFVDRAPRVSPRVDQTLLVECSI